MGAARRAGGRRVDERVRGVVQVERDVAPVRLGFDEPRRFLAAGLHVFRQRLRQPEDPRARGGLRRLCRLRSLEPLAERVVDHPRAVGSSAGGVRGEPWARRGDRRVGCARGGHRRDHACRSVMVGVTPSELPWESARGARWPRRCSRGGSTDRDRLSRRLCVGAGRGRGKRKVSVVIFEIDMLLAGKRIAATRD